MKTLDQLLQNNEAFSSYGNLETEIAHISIDSRTVEKDGLYIAIAGSNSDGHAFIDHAIENGAVAVVCEHLPNEQKKGVTYIQVPNTRETTGYIASAFYDHPSREITLIGVTGTNGKTTVATLVYQFLQLLGKLSAVLSTAGDFFDDKKLEVTRHAPTSIEIVEFNRILRQLVDAGCEYVAFEVSSHALDQGRIAGLDIDVAIYTNLSQDHLDYHKTMENYASAKKKLFDNVTPKAKAVVNIDDSYGKYMVEDTQAEIFYYSVENGKWKVENYNAQGSTLINNDREYHLPLLGTFNIYNTLAAAQALLALGFEEKEVLDHIENLKPITGRAEIVNHPSGVVGVVDYAHTADGLENILTSLQNVLTEDQKLITIIGCGGDRDTTKRKPMADMALKYSDYSIFTSDNPRTEDPEKIIDMMCEGLEESESWTRITDRAEAIAHALGYAQPNDVIVMAGKGHEDYQEINGVKYPFSDKHIFLSIN
ncbi:UDP-N-acetylmuramoyl-L-alanyl-D-glutamate--2,6-diaminopimelate ligase [Candidatus Nomurabacteria bacterium]|nr:UDP-N-acetylmuramoyl-L-alanyl-D-glutamate--2,6-diaminopimelate ligase [Candidatus Nomurabacteria bacterium]